MIGRRWNTWCLLGCLAPAACTPPDSVSDQLQRGRRIYEDQCHACHDGEGGIGPRLVPSVLRTYGRARRLFDYTRLAMPYGAPGTLTAQDYWDVTTYLLATRANISFNQPLDSANADALLPP